MKESNWTVEIIMCLRFPLCFGRISHCAGIIRVSIFSVSLLSGPLLWIRLFYINYLGAIFTLASTLHLKLSLARSWYILPIFVQEYVLKFSSAVFFTTLQIPSIPDFAVVAFLSFYSRNVFYYRVYDKSNRNERKNIFRQ